MFLLKVTILALVEKKTHGQFVVTLIDKANVNVTFICCVFFVFFCVKEMGTSRKEEAKYTEKYKYDLLMQKL